ncbi:hypothetical protein EGI26_02575 [Lacihabitans sp. CCS-44]|uniref:hypothetical protein n=1 Tax=Lacihabitans sp. CCS-44 TaxID=2487331 RepID=UPI0020CE627B|nr:hypothetical protein [Lacihabitans sp. CCS-44]MCP9754046.1 hypothetical protein [Lacihabitans sp. CCS-44]
MKTLVSLLLLCLFSTKSWSQSIDFAIAAKKEFAPSVSYQKTYDVGKKKRFQIGWGVRANGYFSGQKEYLTAPALLTSGKQSLAAFFTEYNPAKIDTIDFSKSSLVSFNALIVLQYSFKKSAIGFNIDALGFTLGGKQSGIFRAAESPSLNKSTQTASPTPLNVLLVSDSDRGSLNSEIFFKQTLKNQNALRFGLSFQFMEYTTKQVLTFENDRFRHKSLMPFVAYTLNLRKK